MPVWARSSVMDNFAYKPEQHCSSVSAFECNEKIEMSAPETTTPFMLAGGGRKPTQAEEVTETAHVCMGTK